MIIISMVLKFLNDFGILNKKINTILSWWKIIGYEF